MCIEQEMELTIRINYYFLEFYLEKIYFQFKPGKLLFLKKFLENIKFFSGFAGKMNFQVCGNPECSDSHF